ncbi:protein ninF [Salmonella enterica subsp. enterica]|nr:protein ninF [Salmonella enterica subsp. enterica]
MAHPQSLQYQKESVERAFNVRQLRSEALHVLEVHACAPIAAHPELMWANGQMLEEDDE